MTVTADTPSGTPRAVASGSHGEPSSSSATQKLNLPGCPRVERSIPPGRTSNRLMRHRRTARPMTAVARSLLPSALNVPSIPSSRRTSPLTTMKTAQPPVLAVAPCRVNSSRSIAASAATTTGKCTGRQPAITALTATFSAVIARARTGSTPMRESGDNAARRGTRAPRLRSEARREARPSSPGRGRAPGRRRRRPFRGLWIGGSWIAAAGFRLLYCTHRECRGSEIARVRPDASSERRCGGSGDLNPPASRGPDSRWFGCRPHAVDSRSRMVDALHRNRPRRGCSGHLRRVARPGDGVLRAFNLK